MVHYLLCFSASRGLAAPAAPLYPGCPLCLGPVSISSSPQQPLHSGAAFRLHMHLLVLSSYPIHLKNTRTKEVHSCLCVQKTRGTLSHFLFRSAHLHRGPRPPAEEQLQLLPSKMALQCAVDRPHRASSSALPTKTRRAPTSTCKVVSGAAVLQVATPGGRP